MHESPKRTHGDREPYSETGSQSRPFVDANDLTHDDIFRLFTKPGEPVRQRITKREARETFSRWPRSLVNKHKPVHYSPFEPQEWILNLERKNCASMRNPRKDNKEEHAIRDEQKSRTQERYAERASKFSSDDCYSRQKVHIQVDETPNPALHGIYSHFMAPNATAKLLEDLTLFGAQLLAAHGDITASALAALAFYKLQISSANCLPSMAAFGLEELTKMAKRIFNDEDKFFNHIAEEIKVDGVCSTLESVLHEIRAPKPGAISYDQYRKEKEQQLEQRFDSEIQFVDDDNYFKDIFPKPAPAPQKRQKQDRRVFPHKSSYDSEIVEEIPEEIPQNTPKSDDDLVETAVRDYEQLEQTLRNLGTPATTRAFAYGQGAKIQGLEDVMAALANCTTGYESIIKSEFTQRILRFFSLIAGAFMVTLGGLQFDSEIFNLVERSFFHGSWKMGADLTVEFVKIVQYLCTKGYEIYTSGSLDPLFHSADKYEQYRKDYDTCVVWSGNLGDPELHNFTKVEYDKKLSDTIATGDVIFKKVTARKDSSVRTVQEMQLTLKKLKADFITAENNSKFRKTPISLLLIGHSKIGKSTIVQMLFKYLGKLHGLPTAEAYSYFYNGEAKHFDDFASYKWFLCIDDAGRYSPKYAPNADPTLTCLFNFINPQPYMPPMASLDDKGKVPMKPKVVVTTANNLSGALQYFQDPGAYFRRFGLRIEPRPKPCYATDGALDDAKVVSFGPIQDAEYPDLWLWDVSVWSFEGRGTWKTLLKDGNMAQFLTLLAQHAIKHDQSQQRMIDSVKEMDKVCLCATCFLPQSLCKCVQDDGFLGPVPNFVPMLKGVIQTHHEHLCAEAAGPSEMPTDMDPKDVWFQQVWDKFESSGWSQTPGPMAETQHIRPHGPTHLQTIEDFDISLEMAFIDIFRTFLYGLIAITGLYYCGGPLLRIADNSRKILINLRSVYHASADMRTAFIAYDNPAAPAAPWVDNLRADFRDIADASRVLKQWSDLGKRMSATIKRPEVIVSIAALASILLTGYVLATRKTTPKDQVQTHEAAPTSPVDAECRPPEKDGVLRINPWYNADLKRHTLDVSTITGTLKGPNTADFYNKVRKNLMHITSTGPCSRLRAKGIVVMKTFLLTNSHCIPDGEFILEFRNDADCGVTRNGKCKISPSRVFRDRKRDLCLVFIENGLQPCADLTNYFVGAQHDIPSTGHYINVSQDGREDQKRFAALRKRESKIDQLPNVHTHLWEGYLQKGQNTVIGDCGSVLILDTPSGPAIAGLHILAMDENSHGVWAAATSVDSDWLKHHCQKLETQVATNIAKYSTNIQSLPLCVYSDGPMLLGAKDFPLHYGELHSRSPARFIQQGNMTVYGSLTGFRASHTSDCCSTPMRDFWKSYGIETDVVAPDLKSWKPSFRTLNIAAQKGQVEIDSEILDRSIADYMDTILSRINPEEFKKVHPYDTYTAINGAAGVSYCEPLNKATSAGQPWRMKKRSLLIPCTPHEGHTEAFDISDEMKERISWMEKQYLQEKRANFLFSAQLKDQAISQKKYDEGKVRVFMACPMDATIMIRKWLLSIIMLIYRNRFAFEMAVGTNTFSSEWGDIQRYQTRMGTVDTGGDGDYANWDINLQSVIAIAPGRVKSGIAKRCGFSPDAQKIVQGIATDIAHAKIDYFGDLLQIPGIGPSGQPATVIDNGISGSVAIRYTFFKLAPAMVEMIFRDLVILITYGDDNRLGINKKIISWFNLNTIAEQLKELGMEYTDSAKSGVMRELVPLDEVSFLKRKWIWDDEIEDYKAPLEIKSILKSLCVWRKSKTETPQKQMLSILEAAHREMFHHGRENFNKFDCLVKTCIVECGLAPFNRPDFPKPWEVYVAEWKECSAACFKSEYSTGERCFVLNQKHDSIDSYLHPSKVNELFEKCNGLVLYQKDPYPFVSLDDELDDSNKIRSTLQAEVNLLSVQQQLAASNIVQMTSSEVEQTTGNMNGLDHTSMDGMTTNTDLGNVFERWIKIDVIDWSVSTSLDSTFSPWSQYFFANDMIWSKLRGYSGLQCDGLELKFLINGSPYQYGAVMVTYKPLASSAGTGWGYATTSTTYDGNYDFSGGKIAGGPIGLSGNILMPISQRQNVWLYPQTSTGATMKLPFMWFKNWIDLSIDSNGNVTDLLQMGYISYKTPVNLLYAGTVPTTPVTITIYARATNVRLSRPTMTIQARDEFNGPVSGPASAVANAAGALSKLPIIGPYALATQMIANTIGSIARWFGFTNVPVITPVHAFRPTALPQLCSPEIGVQLEKLSLDPQQQLTVDPRTVGAKPIDEMDISYLAGKESYIDLTTWNVSDAEGTTLFAGYVTPEYAYTTSITGLSGRNFYSIEATPACHFAQMGKFWRGTMVVRFEVLCTQFHRGRMRFYHDPNGPTATFKEGRVETVILDLRTQTSFEIKIPYQAVQSFLPVTGGAYNSASNKFWGVRGDPSPTYSNAYYNGYFRLDVLNELQCSDAIAPCKILMFVRWENFELCAPNDLNTGNSSLYTSSNPYTIQSAAEMQSPPTEAETISIPAKSIDDEAYHVFMGEVFSSFRQLIHRAVFSTVLPIDTHLNNAQVTSISFPRMGFYPGPGNANLPWSAATSFQLVCSTLTPAQWLSICFVGQRGSVNYHVVAEGSDPVTTVDSFSISRGATANFNNTVAGPQINTSVALNGSNFTTVSYSAFENTPAGIGGMAYTQKSTNAGLQINAPMYSNVRMLPCNPNYFLGPPITGGSVPDTFGLQNDYLVVSVNTCNSTTTTSATNIPRIRIFTSAGPDYNVFSFVNIPTVFRVNPII